MVTVVVVTGVAMAQHSFTIVIIVAVRHPQDHFDGPTNGFLQSKDRRTGHGGVVILRGTAASLEDGCGGGVFEAMVGLFLILGMVLVLALLVMVLVMVMAMMLAIVLVMVLGMVLVLLKNLYRIC